METINPPLEEVTVTAKRPYTDYSLNVFKSQDFLKSSQFLFRLPKHPVNSYSKIEKKKFSMFCESVEFPGKSLDTIDYKIPGTNKIRVPYGRELNEVTCTFIHSIEIPIYDFFSQWIDQIAGYNNSTENAYYDENKVDFELMQFPDLQPDTNRRFGGLSNLLGSIDKLNANLFDSSNAFKVTDIGQTFVNRINANKNEIRRKEYYTVSFKDAYPVSFASMSSNWADDGYHRMSVTWAYEKFIIRN